MSQAETIQQIFPGQESSLFPALSGRSSGGPRGSNFHQTSAPYPGTCSLAPSILSES